MTLPANASGDHPRWWKRLLSKWMNGVTQTWWMSLRVQVLGDGNFESGFMRLEAGRLGGPGIHLQETLMGKKGRRSWMVDHRTLHQFHPDESLSSRGHDIPANAPHQSDAALLGQPDANQGFFPSSPPPYNDPGIDSQQDTQMDRDSYDDEAQAQKKIMETYQGCSQAFFGGLTFMDLFWQDQYAEERQENLYYPFASCDEWQFTS
ncbi:hypothetical protein OG21DRAFT_1526454 [Imleria badia]|nr:hypothetical protein OG21DRAFT_1526454 [Imleria badia]